MSHAHRRMMMHCLAKHLCPRYDSYGGLDDHRVSFPTEELAIRACYFLLTRPETKHYVSRYRTCLSLRIPRCWNCQRLEPEHVNGKCLFEATAWKETPKPMKLRPGAGESVKSYV